MISKIICFNNIIDVINIHKNSYLSDHFTNKMSDDLLSEYYLMLSEASNGLSFVMYMDTKPVGFVIAGEGLNNIVKTFVKKNFSKIFFILLKNPKYLFPKFVAFFSRFSRNKWKSSADCRVLSIAVDAKLQGQGIGKKLLGEFETRYMSSQPQTSIYGLSVKNSNISAIGFYLSNQFSKERTDKKSSYFIKVLK